MVAQAISRTARSTDVVRVLVVDDHLMFAQLLRISLDDQPDLECIGIAGDVEAAFAMVASLRPDLVLMDARLQDGDGVAATAELVTANPDLRVVVLSGHIDSNLMRRAAEAGACALHPKDGDLADILQAVRTARSGTFVVQPKLLRSLITEPRCGLLQNPSLTVREHDVLHLLAAGLDTAVIAHELGISMNTCRGYVKTLLAKLGAHSQLEAVVIAMRSGLVGVGDAAT